MARAGNRGQALGLSKDSGLDLDIEGGQNTEICENQKSLAPGAREINSFGWTSTRSEPGSGLSGWARNRSVLQEIKINPNESEDQNKSGIN